MTAKAKDVITSLLDKGASILLEEMSLQNAIKDGDIKTPTKLMDVISIVDKKIPKGMPLLSLAACDGHANIVKLAISQGADIESIDDYGLTPLHVACREGHLEIVQFLVSEGGDINRQTFDGMTPLAMATTRGHVEVLKYLISKGVEIERSDKNGCPPLIWACCRGHLSIVNYLLHAGADVNGAVKCGWTSLHFSIFYDRLDVIKSLVSVGADLNWPDKDGTTPLNVACRNGRIQILKYLLSNGADLQIADFDGTTPLHIASAKGHHDIVSFILQLKEGGELVNRPDARGETPLHIATSNGITSIIDILVYRGGDINAETNEGQTCLHLAAKLCEGSTDVEVTKELSKLMVGNSKDSLGPAESQIMFDHLIRKGAKVNIVDKAEKKPLEFVSHEMANLGVSTELTESHALGGSQRGGASNDVDRTGSNVISKTHPGKGAPHPTRSSSAIPEEVLLHLSEEIPNDRILTLGLKLGLNQATVARFEATNVKGTEVTSKGNRAMLFSWFNCTAGAEAIPTLQRALEESGLVRLAEKYLKHF